MSDEIKFDIVRLANGEFDDTADVHVFHGVVIENDSLTFGGGGPKFWPAETLKKAAGTLTGKPVVNGHTYDENGKPTNESVVGRVIQSVYDPAIGWVYQMEIGDTELARKLHNGHLDVSVHGGGAADGEHESGAPNMVDMFATDLAIVPLGGSPSNSANPGPLVAQLSHEDLAVRMGAAVDGVVDESRLEETEQETAEESTNHEAEESEESAETVDPEENEIMEEKETPEGIDLEGKVVVEESRHEELLAAESQLEESQAKVSELETTLEAQKAQIEEVAEVYQVALSERTGMRQEFFDGMTVEKLKVELENLSEDDDALVELAASTKRPTPQTAGGESEESDDVEVELDAETAEEIENLKESIELYREWNWTGAAKKAESRLAELTE